MNQDPPVSWQDSALVDLWFQRINYERQTTNNLSGFKLDAVERLLSLLGNPQNRYPIVHIAGTKGKGSVTRMIAGVLQAAGYRAGSYTSPHLERVNQRYEINQTEISNGQLHRQLAEIWPTIEASDFESDRLGSRRLTFFDIATALGFWHFAQEHVDAAVVEVGLGGRLDSTNVCQPVVTAITSISLDHTRQLGNTLAEIASEKAGIIKPGIPVICGVTEIEPQSVIHEVAARQGAPLLQIGRDFGTAIVELGGLGSQFDYWLNWQSQEFRENDLRITGLGRHQIHNASLALTALNLLGMSGFDRVGQGIRAGLIQYQHAGRIEIVCQAPTVVVDVAHNEASLNALIETLVEQLPSWRLAKQRTLILAISRDKNQREMLELALGHFTSVIFTRFLNNPRATPQAQLLEWAHEICQRHGWQPRLETADTPLDAWRLAQVDLGAEDVCCIAGSLFLAAELRSIFV